MKVKNRSFLSSSSLIMLCLGFALLVRLLAGNSTLSPQGQNMLAIAALMSTLWISEAIPIAATALLPLALFPVFGIMNSKSVALHFGNHLIFLYVGGFLIAVAMQKWNLHRRIALLIVSLVGTSPRRIVLGFMAATAFLSMWISNTATTMMMFPIAIAVVFQVLNITSKDDYNPSTIESGFATAIMLGIAYAASIGGISTLVGTPPNVVLVGMVQKMYPQTGGLSFGAWMVLTVPFSITFLLIVWVGLTRFFFKGAFEALEEKHISSSHIAKERKKMGKLAYEEKWVATVFVLTALLWITRQSIDFGPFILPGWSSLVPFGAKYHDTTVAMAMGLLLFFIPSKARKSESESNLLHWDEFERQAPWGVLILFGGGFALAAGIEEAGVAQWIAHFLVGFKGLPVVVLMLATCVLITFLTEITSNLATTAVLLPILGPAAVGMGLHPFILMVPAAISASCAFMLPVATPPNAIVYSSGWIQISQMSRVGIVFNLIGVVLATLLVTFFSRSILGYTTYITAGW